MSVAIAQSLSLAYGKKVLLDGDGFAIGPRDRIGLVGANGTGKSSLMKILAGVLTPDSGSVQFSRRSRAGYLPQDIAAVPTGTLIESVLSAVPGRDQLEGRVAETEQALSAATDEAQQLECAQQLADLHAELEHFEEHYGRHRAERILAGLGFREAELTRPTASLSGGWRMRAALAGLLLQDPELLLLDEPTNHLDVPTLTWFDEFLRRSQKALVLISHDRTFLNSQISRVLSLEVEGLRSYVGNYDRYREQRAQEVEQLKARAARQAAKRAEVEAFIDRFGAKATKARQAQSRAKMLEKEEVIEVLEERQTVHFHFPEVSRSGRDIVTLRQVRRAYGDHVVYEALSQTLERGQRVAVIGANGAGKTTLLKLIAGELTPDSGEIALGHNVVMGYYAQHHAETLNRSSTVLDEVRKLVPDKPESFVRGTLGAFLFSGDDVDKLIGVLSGGERARVALAKLLLVPANFLLMDEPTNHLDLDSSEMLIEALKSYGGTLLFVSHNRSFVNQLATHVWDVRDGGVYTHSGNLDDYLYHQRQLENAATATPEAGVSASRPAASDKDRRRVDAELRQRRSVVEGPIRKEISQIESEIARLESQVKQGEIELADPGLYQDFAKAKPRMDAHREAKTILESLYTKWEDANQRLVAAADSSS